MQSAHWMVALLLVGCTSDPEEVEAPAEPEPVTCDSVLRANCVEIAPGDSDALLAAINSLVDDSAVVLGEGTYTLNNAVTVREANAVTLIGQGIDRTILDFGTTQAQVNGVDMVGDDMHVEGFTILDAVKDGLRIEESNGVIIRAIKATWTNENDETNGGYGLYPVRVTDVLMEDSEAYNASDAGIYVGQCANAVIRNNIAKQNVAGIEIENTQYAEVYGNLAEDNTGGLVVFDLPGNPIIGHDVRIFDNQIINNNRPNFAPGGTVALIPAGTGTFAMASRRVQIDGNTYANNQTIDIALLSGLAVFGDPEQWYIEDTAMVGDIAGLSRDDMGDLSGGNTDDGVYNYRTYDIYIHNNTHSGSGTSPDFDIIDPNKFFGTLVWALYGAGGAEAQTVDTVLYDTIGESSFDPADAGSNSNDNRICVGNGGGLTMAAMHLEEIDADPERNMWPERWLFQPDAPFAPYDCMGPTLATADVDA